MAVPSSRAARGPAAGCHVDIPRANRAARVAGGAARASPPGAGRGDAAALTRSVYLSRRWRGSLATLRRSPWIFHGDQSRRRCGCDVDIPWRPVAATPRLRRGYSVETSRGVAAAATIAKTAPRRSRGAGADRAHHDAAAPTRSARSASRRQRGIVRHHGCRPRRSMLDRPDAGRRARQVLGPRIGRLGQRLGLAPGRVGDPTLLFFVPARSTRYSAEVFRGVGSQRRRGRDVDISRRRVAATPRPRRGYSAEAHGDGSRRRRDVDIPRRRVAAAPRPRRG